MNNITQMAAFKAFRRGDLSQLEFIPNIQELRDNFMKALEKTCCRSRRRVVIRHRQLFFEAFREANQ